MLMPKRSDTIHGTRSTVNLRSLTGVAFIWDRSISCRSSEWVACNILAPHSAGQNHSDCSWRPLDSRQSADVEAKVSRVIFKSLCELARGIDIL